MKKTLTRTLAFTLMLCMLITAIPLTVSAEDDHTCKVTYYTDPFNNPTGIKEINIDSTTYYDCSKGVDKGTVDAPYLKKVLLNNVEYENKKYSNILEDWAGIAAAIFENGGIYTCCPDDNGDGYKELYGKGYSNPSNENCYVGAQLANNMGSSNGSIGSDYRHTTGLSETTSLNALREKMAAEIEAGIDKKNCSGKYILGQGNCKEEALPELKENTKNQTVLYNMVTSVSCDGGTFKYRYNSYCLAFYNFELSIIEDEELEYVMKSDGSMGELTPEALRKETTYVATQTNNTAEESTMNLSFETGSSETISTSLQKSTTLTFGQNVGIDASFAGIGVSTGFSCEEAFSTVTTEEKSVSHSESSTTTTSCSLPPYTQAVVKNVRGLGISTLSYDVPVALTFDVAIFSMSGDVYADGDRCSSMSSLNYSQRYFYTTFGENNKNAYESLGYRRANTELNGSDSINGNTHVFFKRHNGGSKYDNKLDYDINWNKVENTRNDNLDTSLAIADLAKRVPMIPVGAKSKIICETIHTEIYDYEPLYLPTSIRVTNLGDINQNVKPKSTINLNRLKIDAFNEWDVPYYGFRVKDGHWEICEGSEDVLKMTPGSNTLTVIGKDGDVGCVQWVLNDNVEYTAARELGTATKSTLNPVIIQFSVMDDVIIIN